MLIHAIDGGVCKVSRASVIETNGLRHGENNSMRIAVVGYRKALRSHSWNADFVGKRWNYISTFCDFMVGPDRGDGRGGNYDV